MSFEDYNDMVEALLVLFEEYISKDIDTGDVEWCVSRAGVELCQWMLDDLHIAINVTKNKVVLHCPDELGRKYLKRKVELIWKTIQEIGDAD